MSVDPRHQHRQHRRGAPGRRALRGGAALAGAALAAGAAVFAAGRYGAARTLRPAAPPGFADGAVTLLGADGSHVVLSPGPAALLPGVYGLTGDGVHAVIGEVEGSDGTGEGPVVRRLHGVLRGTLRPGARLRITPQVYETPTLEPADVVIEDELGGVPAWFVFGTRDTWVVTAHGTGAGREQALNVLPALNRFGLPVLMPAHRGDPGAPRPADPAHEEWRDLEAAVRYAVSHGARRVVLYGWSTGAERVLRTAAASELRDRISGVVLDSPVLDARAAMRALGEERSLPTPLRYLAAMSTPATTAALSEVWSPPGAPQTLLLRGEDDTLTPREPLEDLAAHHPDRVQVHTVAGGRHGGLWNVDPGAYEERVRRAVVPLV
ncbi:alpha/beta hydrolase [Streptomyces polyrhachis]|uniref:Alpha/beta hydrolase n=1 Tax=Streptomyces polyrhachis TaxID=1282885 RepID=A0ABW2GGF1_9ACTN